MTAGAMTEVGPTLARRRFVAFCLAIPAAVLLAAYVWLAADRGTPALWNVVVHESGRYTLGETVLYVRHFLREVPTVVAYALFLAAAVGGSARADGSPPTRRTHVIVGLGGSTVVLCVALIAATRQGGWSSAMRDLLQFRTRDDLVAYGSHWHFHWLSTLWFGALVTLAPSLTRSLFGQPLFDRSRARERIAWGYFVATTLVFGLSVAVFTDVRYAGHQAREILTHGPVTALLGLGVLLSTDGPRVRGSAGPPTRLTRGDWVRLAAVIVIPVYVGAVALGGDVMAAGQSDRGLAAMVGAHYFEHTLDYPFVILLALGVLGLPVARRIHPGAPPHDE